MATGLGAIVEAQAFGAQLARKTVAFTGAVLIVLFGVLSFQEVIGAIDFNAIALLLGMMVLVSALKVVGFFSLLARSYCP